MKIIPNSFSDKNLKGAKFFSNTTPGFPAPPKGTETVIP
jgi:hypothetical protein